MKKLSLILAAVVLFGSISFAAPKQDQPKEKKVEKKEKKVEHKEKKVDKKEKKVDKKEKKNAK